MKVAGEEYFGRWIQKNQSTLFCSHLYPNGIHTTRALTVQSETSTDHKVVDQKVTERPTGLDYILQCSTSKII